VATSGFPLLLQRAGAICANNDARRRAVSGRRICDSRAPATPFTPWWTRSAAATAPWPGHATQSAAGGRTHREPVEEQPAPVYAPRAEPPERRDFKPASPAAVTEAIDEVNIIITSLKQVLDTMEEILETLELAEVQKTADEREIQSLRNALRNIDRRIPEPRREGRERENREPSDARGDEPRGPDRRPGRR
jgi:hypothetical protein